MRGSSGYRAVTVVRREACTRRATGVCWTGMTTKPTDLSQRILATPKLPTDTPIEEHAAPVKTTGVEVRQPQPGDDGASTDDADDGTGGASAP